MYSLHSQQWTDGFSRRVLDRAEDEFGFTFPPDLRSLLLDRSPVSGHDWQNLDQLTTAFEWPFEGLLFDIEHNDFWRAEWGHRPLKVEERAQILRKQIAKAPKLLPLIGHRYLPADPCESGNPVFSVYQSDIIHYGRDLDDYFTQVFSVSSQMTDSELCKPIRFWSDLVGG